MASGINGRTDGYTFQWKIENVSDCWWLKKGEGIESPVFFADALEKTKWILFFYPIETENESSVGVYLQRDIWSGPDDIEITYQFALLGEGGTILNEKMSLVSKFSKNDNWGWADFEKRERVFVTEREAYLPEDTLTVQCTIWTTNEKPDSAIPLFATTVVKIKRRYFVWTIDRPDNFECGIKNKFGDYLISCNLILHKNLDGICIDMFELAESVKYISCNIWVKDSEERKENCGINKFFAEDLKKLPIHLVCTLLSKKLIENKGQYFPEDVLTLEFEFVLATIENSECRGYCPRLENEVVGNEKSEKTEVLSDDLFTLYNDGIFSDIQIRTSTKIFSAHKNILGARSPVFRSMFSQDMMEKNSGYVDIPDFEDDIIDQMLVFMYTDSLENLKRESAFSLYKIADKYQILSLKRNCSSFLIESLCPTNACDILVLADLHNDDYLKRYVQFYILRDHKRIFFSEEWKDLMRNHLKLAACIMYKKLTKIDFFLP